MKYFIVIFLFVGVCSKGSTQSCLSDGINFSTQKEIDDFASNYPQCKIIMGDVCIGDCTSPYVGTDINNLLGLSQINRFENHVLIQENPLLNNLMGLHNLQYIGNRLSIWGTNNITNLEGLDQLDTIKGQLFIWQNNTIKNLEGLDSLSHLGSDLRLWNNGALLNLSGLEKLKSIGGTFEIQYNDKINNLNGVEQIRSIGKDITVYKNKSLLSFEALSNLNTIGGSLYIEDNDILYNLNGLEQLNTINGSLYIANNNYLSNIDGILNIDPTSIKSNTGGIKDLEIHGNEFLPSCQTKSVCDFLQLEDVTMDIHDNALYCDSAEDILEECISRIELETQINKINIYPNPATQSISILNNTNNKIEEINIYNQFGQNILHLNYTSLKVSSIPIEISNFNNGVYIVELLVKNNAYLPTIKINKKLVINHL